MIVVAANQQFFIDVRTCDRPDQLSYDLSQHLPRRLSVGPVAVLADNPPVFLSVIRKRLAKLRYELERERARTLDRTKRAGLTRELARLDTARFTTRTDKATPDVLCTLPHILAKQTARYRTIYVTTGFSNENVESAIEALHPGGLLVVYDGWTPQLQTILGEYQMV